MRRKVATFFQSLTAGLGDSVNGLFVVYKVAGPGRCHCTVSRSLETS